MTKAAKPKGGTRKPKRLEPADVLQERMEYYTKLAKAEMKRGALGSREKIDEYLKLAQDAAKELGPYRHGRASGTEQEEKKSYVMRLDGPIFKTGDEWLLYYKMVEEKESNSDLRLAFKEASDSMMARYFKDYKPPADTKMN